MPEEQGVAVDGAYPGDHTVDPVAHLLGGLAARRRVAPDRPPGDRAPDLLRADPLVLAVRPLREILVGDRGGETFTVNVTKVLSFAD